MESFEKNIIHTTKEGRMYIEKEDFFKQEKVLSLIKRFKISPTIKKIDQNRKVKLV